MSGEKRATGKKTQGLSSFLREELKPRPEPHAKAQEEMPSKPEIRDSGTDGLRDFGTDGLRDSGTDGLRDSPSLSAQGAGHGVPTGSGSGPAASDTAVTDSVASGSVEPEGEVAQQQTLGVRDSVSLEPPSPAEEKPLTDDETLDVTDSGSTVQPKSQSPRKARKGTPLYLRLNRKEVRFREDQLDKLTELARKLNRARRGSSSRGQAERITENSLVRVAVDVLLKSSRHLQGASEAELLQSILSKLQAP